MTFRPTPAKLLALGLTLSAVAAAGCGSSSSSSSSSAPAAPATSTAAPAGGTAAKSGPVAIAYRGFAIDPADVTVKVGQKITWTNYDSTTHNVVFKPGDPAPFTSKDFTKGGTASFTPTKPGVYQYLCTFHAGSMQGKITVTA